MQRKIILLADFSTRVVSPLLRHKSNSSVAKSRLIYMCFCKENSSLLNYLKWALLGVLTNKEERIERNSKGLFSFGLLFYSQTQMCGICKRCTNVTSYAAGLLLYLGAT